MPQRNVWEKEYQNPQLLAPTDKPQKETVQFFKYLRKKHGIQLAEAPQILDIGAGNGRNANYLAKKGAVVSGIEISPTAVKAARVDAYQKNVDVDYTIGNFGEPLPFQENEFDVAIDVTSSNSLNEQERACYIEELSRVLKPNGHYFLKTLCLEGDKNAKNLLQQQPGPEYHTYILKELNLVERVFSREDIKTLYEPYFEIVRLDKKESYTKMNNQSYKRKFWIAYLRLRKKYD